MQISEERAGARERPRQVSAEQAIAEGLKPDPPTDRRCPYCGDTLDPLGILVGDRVLWVGTESCGCSGEVMAAKEQEQLQAQELAQEERSRLTRSGIRRRYLEAEPNDSVCKGYADVYVTGTGVGLYVHGPVGVGKTYNVSGIAAELVRKGKNVIMTSALKILSDIKETYDTRESSKEELARYTSCEILILDDLGKESASKWAVMTLFDLINTRYEQMLPIILTSQYTLDGLERRLGRTREFETAAAIISRIRETCVDVALTGPDMRKSIVQDEPEYAKKALDVKPEEVDELSRFYDSGA